MENHVVNYTAKNKKKRKRQLTKNNYQNVNMYRLARVAALQVVNKNVEVKRKIYDFSAVGIDPVAGAAASFGSISYGSGTIITQLGRGIIQGTSESQRVGSVINVKKVRINFAIQNIDETNYLRFVLLKNKGRYATTSVSSLAQSIMSGEASSSTQWLSDIDTKYFKVYMDEKIFMRTLNSDGTNGAIDSTILSKTIKFPGNGLRMEWDTQNISPQEDLLLCAWSDSGVVSHPGVVAGKCTLYYTDA